MIFFLCFYLKKKFEIFFTSTTAVLHNIRMTTERITLVHQFVFIKGSLVKRYYLLNLLPSYLNEQL